MAKDQYYYEPITWAAQKGIALGMTETEFWPEDTCTRGQIVTFLWRAAGKPEPEAKGTHFTDVKKTDYFYEAVLWAEENGIALGAAENEFQPEEKCTRAQALTFLWRAAEEPEPEKKTTHFTDVKKTDYFYKAVLWAEKNGIALGMTKDGFGPDGECTRGQVLTFLFRFKQLSKKS